MLKRRVVLGTPDIPVRNGVTRIIYPTGSMYEGEVRDGKRHGLGVYTWKVLALCVLHLECILSQHDECASPAVLSEGAQLLTNYIQE